MDAGPGPDGSFRPRIEADLARCLNGRPDEDVVAMCLRKPESEANDALRTALNVGGSAAGHIARREATGGGVARVDLVIQDLPTSLQPLVAIESKAMMAADAMRPDFEQWFDHQIEPDVQKLRRHPAAERFVIAWKLHWAWMAQPDLFAYPRLLRSTPRTRIDGYDHLAAELSTTGSNVSRVMRQFGVRDLSLHFVRVATHADVGCVVLTAHLGRVT